MESPTIAATLQWVKNNFPQVETLDAEVLLAHVLQVQRAHLIAWPENKITPEQKKQFEELIARCAEGEPVAYLVGTKEFWSLNLNVNPETLIPRPETELIVGVVLNTLSDGSPKRIVDLGTGAGTIALAIAKERPQWEVHATDKFPQTLSVAKQNARALHLHNIKFHNSDWFAALPNMLFDAIISNPPYISVDDPNIMSQVKRFEPSAALFAEKNGLADLEKIIMAAQSHLHAGGYIFLEHGFEQASSVNLLLENVGFTHICLYQDLGNKDRVTVARKKLS